MSKKRKRRRKRTQRVVTRREWSVTQEAIYIAERAAEHDSRVVTLGPLVFFSAESGDAWMLDLEDGLAVCLARNGTALPVEITETAQSYEIRWKATYRIEGETFLCRDGEGRETAILGYPTAEITHASARVLT